jgi:hypothetical protein
MTSRERVLSAFRHIQPDRTPIFEKLIKSPVADELLGRPHAGQNFHYQMQRLADGDWRGLWEQAARDEIDLAKMLGFDLVHLHPNPGPPAERPVRLNETTWRIGRILHERLESGWVQVRDPEAIPVPEAQQEADMIRWLESDWQSIEHAFVDDNIVKFRAGVKIIADEGLDLAVFVASYGLGVATIPPYMLRWFVDDRRHLHDYYERNAQNSLVSAIEQVEEGAHIVGLGGDFACDHGPVCSPRDYAEFIAPRIAMQSRKLHAMGAFTTNASDGDLWPVLNDFLVTSEVDGFEEIDFAAGMDMARLKREYGDTHTFMGNVDIRHTLTSGTVAQVKEHTKRCIEDGLALSPGGHVLMSGNCIHENVKTDLFLAHIEAYREFWGL